MDGATCVAKGEAYTKRGAVSAYKLWVITDDGFAKMKI